MRIPKHTGVSMFACTCACVRTCWRHGVCVCVHARVCCLYIRKSLVCGSRGGKLGYTVFKLGGRVDFKVDCRVWVRVRYVRSSRTLIYKLKVRAAISSCCGLGSFLWRVTSSTVSHIAIGEFMCSSCLNQ